MSNSKPVQGQTASMPINMEYSTIVERAKQQAIKRRAASPVQVELIPKYIKGIEKLIESRAKDGKPVTFAAVAMAMDVSCDTLYRMIDGRLDYVIEEYRIVHDIPDDVDMVEIDGKQVPLITFSDLLQKRVLPTIQDRLECNIYNTRGNHVGSIFALKSRYGWQDEHAPKYQQNNLIVADKDKADALLSMVTSTHA